MEELFWNYIDGTATESEKLEVKSLLESDNDALKLYNQIKVVDRALEKATLSPSVGFTASILNRAFPKLHLERASFKPIIYIFAALVFISFLISFTPMANGESSGLIDWSILKFNFEISPQYLIYGLSAFSAVVVIWLDLLYQKKKMV
jgi:hypothetical protein